MYELAPLRKKDRIRRAPGETAELAGAIREAARIETESVRAVSKNGHQQVVLTYATLLRKDLSELRDKIIDILDSLPPSAKGKRHRRARVIYAAYQLDE